MPNLISVHVAGKATIADVIARSTVEFPERVAIAAPGAGAALSYSDFELRLVELSDALRRLGLGSRNRIATLLPGGLDTAALSVAIMAKSAFAPLNPTTTPTELERYLRAVGAQALIVQANVRDAILDVAHNLNLRIVVFDRTRPAELDLIAPGGSLVGSRQQDESVSESDIALVLHTSGTTSNPKVVPLTQRNVSLSACNIARSLGLQPTDRCLDPMPLYHVHGLIGGLLSSLSAGASAVCPTEFVATDFFDWLDEMAPTWYTAVPTIHQSVLARASSASHIIARRPLRFVRSCSSPLPEHVANELMSTFQCPVIEAYGMTEAAHQLATTPVGEARRAGSVGKASGLQLAVMGEHGQLLPANTVGEIVAKGHSLMRGYENNPHENTSAFLDGWFRTGDEGRLDADGYLYITGRIKELINRAGEKIAPREVEEVLLDHPAVAEAVAFAMPDPALGEVPAAVVVLRNGLWVDPSTLRELVALRLAPFKVPRLIEVVDQIPKGATGKPQRIQIAAAHRDAGWSPGAARTGQNEARSSVEGRLAEIWSRILRVERDTIRRNHTFTDAGGDSILAVRLLTMLEDAFGVEISLLEFSEHPTLQALASVIERRLVLNQRDNASTQIVRESSGQSRSLVPIQTRGSLPPIYLIHGVFGDVTCFAELARELGDLQPVYGLQAHGLDGCQRPIARVEHMATAYIAEVRAHQPAGPYHLVGYSSGGSVAFEMAHQLRTSGETVGLLGVIDHAAHASGYDRPIPSLTWLARAMVNIKRSIPVWRQTARYDGWRNILARTLTKARLPLRRLRLSIRPDHRADWEAFKLEVARGFAEYLGDVPNTRMHLIETQYHAVRSYSPATYAGTLTLFRASRQPLLCSHAPDFGWGGFVDGKVVVRTITGTHYSVLNRPDVEGLAHAVQNALVTR
jgi:acyl-CoA synthetase (AMP-forming)/AMP-acid ligase II/thioesterase domain-containing protein/acyl carrier protein